MLLTTALPVGAALAQAPAATSQRAAQAQYSIPAGNLAHVINRFADVSGLQIVSGAETMRGRKSDGISGAFSQREALDRLLRGTGLSYRYLNRRTVTIYDSRANLANAQAEISLTTINVEGTSETAYGPVEGYVAQRSATGTKTDTPLKETPQSVSVVTADEVKDQGATTVQEALRYVPGVSADAYGPDSRGDFALIRGVEPTMYLDGTRFVNPGAYYNYPKVDPYALERIEVLRGPASVIYGGATIGGLVNMVSKRPQPYDIHEIGVQYGSFNRKQFQTDHAGKLSADGQWLYRLIGVARDSDTQTDYVQDDRAMIMPAITWRPTNNTDWTVLATLQKDKSGSTTAFLPHSGTLFSNPNGQIPVGRFASYPDFEDYTTETKSISSLLEHRFGNTAKVRQNMRYARIDGVYHSAYPDNYSNPANPYLDAAQRTVARYVYSKISHKDTFNADTNAELKFASGPLQHHVLVGFDYRMEKDRGETGFGYDATPFDLYSPTYTSVVAPALSPYATSRQDQLGVYGQDQMRLDRWIVTGGIRRDFVKSDFEGQDTQRDSATTMRFGVMYELPFGLNPYVSYSESFEPIFGAGTCATFCQPKRGQQYEAGFKFSQSKNLVINGAVFDITERNRTTSDPSNPFVYIQTGKARIRGAELEVLATIARDVDLIGAYTYLDTEVLEGDNAGKHLNSVPEQQASLWAKYRFSLFGVSGFSIGGGVRLIGKSWDGTDTIVTPSYALYDAMAAWENKNWRFQINGTNLADNIHVTTCLSRGDCFYGARRTILAQLTYKFGALSLKP